jgi:hypothetical protein
MGQKLPDIFSSKNRYFVPGPGSYDLKFTELSENSKLRS